jgi:hypothetical protein
MAGSPSFAAAPNVGLATIGAANLERDGSGTLVDVVTGGANGTRVEFVVWENTAKAAHAANTLKLFLFDGTNNRFFHEVAVPAKTPSATAVSTRVELDFRDKLYLNNASWKLKACIGVYASAVDVWHVIATGADM